MHHIAYNVFERYVLAHADAIQVSERMRHRARLRSLLVLAIFTTAMLIAFVAPRVGFGLICCGLTSIYGQRSQAVNLSYSSFEESRVFLRLITVLLIVSTRRRG